MSIDWTAFTPWSALAGGILIGLSASLLLLLHGRIAGISGIVGGLLQAPDGDNRWRIAFLGGLIVAPLVWTLAAGAPTIQVDAGYPTLILAGLLVGFFTRMGAGCTSGHGVCGLSRLSPRSLVATLSFMATGFATVFVLRHLLGA
ncbi:YeeE/YedE family protein [Methylonatrum kenyense]|uniref:YeeE/YedE family protein n=1 Tax=Methylonatrum kenyense TaxID=455253 RepID=UPI0020BF10D2|nr:YeeE/YedE family protein [Methylonatrum kenyense]MCK8515202.1 YeeE/YedE family protein [Methylonatrum kenyense]